MQFIFVLQSFVDNSSFCGETTHCFRSSFTSYTWSTAHQTCRSLNGTLASIDIDGDLPIGKFWVAMKKDVQWRWLDGTVSVNIAYQFQSVIIHASYC